MANTPLLTLRIDSETKARFIEWAKNQNTNASEFLKSVIDRCLDGSIDVSTFQVKPSVQDEGQTNLDERIDKYLENNIDRHIDERIVNRLTNNINAIVNAYLDTNLDKCIDKRENAAIGTLEADFETKLGKVREEILGKLPA